MADMPAWQPFTKAVCASPVEPIPPASPGLRVRENDPRGLKRRKKCQAKTPEGMMRLGRKIIEDGLPQGSGMTGVSRQGTARRAGLVKTEHIFLPYAGGHWGPQRFLTYERTKILRTPATRQTIIQMQ
jgi:hypothetical protein